MYELSEVGASILIFLTGVWVLTKLRKEVGGVSKYIFISLSLGILIYKGPISLFIFMAVFVPYLSVSENQKMSQKVKVNSSTIQEKMIVYLSLMPIFGLYILKRDDFHSQLLKVNLPTKDLFVTEIGMAIAILLATYGLLRIRRKV